jgi:Rap1a immunity proteins
MFMRRSREGGNPVVFVRTTLSPRLRGDEGITPFNCGINLKGFPMRVLMQCLILCAALISAAHADDERLLGASLLNWLNSNSDANAGAAYIYGVVDTMKAQRKAARLPDAVCLPVGMEEAQMADIMRRYLSQNIQRLREPAAALVQEVLARELPCK